MVERSEAGRGSRSDLSFEDQKTAVAQPAARNTTRCAAWNGMRDLESAAVGTAVGRRGSFGREGVTLRAPNKGTAYNR